MEEGTDWTDGKMGEHGKILTKEEEKKEGLKQSGLLILCCGFFHFVPWAFVLRPPSRLDRGI